MHPIQSLALERLGKCSDRVETQRRWRDALTPGWVTACTSSTRSASMALGIVSPSIAASGVGVFWILTGGVALLSS
jgi:hypothetical protein